MSTPRRHLMTPGQPVPVREPMSLSTVQKWVLSTLTASTIMHLSFGMIAAAHYLKGETPRQIGLLVIAAIFGVIAIAAARLIHQTRLWSLWLLTGIAPAVLGGWWVLG